MVQGILLGFLDDQASSGRSKTVDSEVVLQTIVASQARSIRRVSGKLIISEWLVAFITSIKAPGSAELYLK